MTETRHSAVERGAHVYLLSDPATRLIMYVGQSRDVQARLTGHLAAARAWRRELALVNRLTETQLSCVARRGSRRRFAISTPRVPTELAHWLAACLDERTRPDVAIVETLHCEQHCGCPFVNECRRARQRESVWIDRLSRRGHPLLNRTMPTVLPRPAEAADD